MRLLPWRALTLSAALATSSALSLAQAPTLPLDPNLGLTNTLPLWPGTPPGNTGAPDPATEPTLTVFRPQPGHENGTAVIVAPGGAYLGLAANLEGRQVADWFAARGVTAFVLRYRLGAHNLYPLPLEDAQRAIQLVRSLSTADHLDPHRIGIIGFSAGGHLAASTATLFHGSGASPTGDPVSQLSDRPDFLILGYPWLNAMQPNQPAGTLTYCSALKLTGPTDCSRFDPAYTPANHVTSGTPTTFIFSTTDDATVPVSASVTFYNALVAQHVPAELHLFRHGSHGSGLGSGDPSLDLWPILLESWMRDQNLLSAPRR